ncbi:helix-turn-helix transcriptional regulator [Agromyces cerinus]|uniref:Predicted DNA-binding transcriptional regulator YafY, contains an HTH and WYL domains n=1 Tax=Agromyces cerinus subsp. cerinus TaxID=232089 RepID=A0A1N6GEZ0_9MICO|nr:YafY family protein [Agromyces cerinus]SIO06095.1 Predicted DNA-binding transcriptional regulator YafY, contains an HTH and WYL domains [Agromyces cerinus subsp. cerinus]
MAATTSRTLELLSLLQSHRHWSARELVDRLGVSDRTLRRDVDRLRELGYGIESARGSAGGYRLEAGTGLPPLLLSDDEGVAIAVGLRSQATAGLRGAEHTTLSALAKIEQVLPPALRRRIEALQSHAAVGAGGPGSGRSGRPTPEVDSELLGLLALGCRDSERLRFTYTDAAGEASARVVEPYRLVPVARRWYLLAWDRQREDWRTFRLDRMSDVFPTRVRFEPRPMGDDDARARVEAAVRWRDRSVKATVVAEMPQADLVEHLGWYGRDVVAVDADHCAWPLEADSVENLSMALMWMPRGVRYRVEGPPELLDFLAMQAERFAEASARG